MIAEVQEQIMRGIVRDAVQVALRSALKLMRGAATLEQAIVGVEALAQGLKEDHDGKKR